MKIFEHKIIAINNLDETEEQSIQRIKQMLGECYTVIITESHELHEMTMEFKSS